MTLYAKAVLFLLAGTLGWGLFNSGLNGAWPRAVSHVGYFVDMSLAGLLLGAVEAATLDGTRRRWAVVLLGAGGSVAGVLGSNFVSMHIGQHVGSWSESFGGPENRYLLLVSGYVFFALLGLLLGVFLSLPRRSLTLTFQYALGGLIGGFSGEGLGNLVYGPLRAHGVPYSIPYSLPVGLAAFGIGIVPALFKQTWLTADTIGKRETPLVRSTVTLGSDPNADIHVPANPAVAPVHALVETLPGMNRRRLRHVAGGTGTHAFPATRVNGRPVSGEQWLADGDVLQIGPRQWTFHDRATRGEMRLGPAAADKWGKAKSEEAPPGPPSLGGGSPIVQGAFHLSPQDAGEAKTTEQNILPPNLGGRGGLSSAPQDIGRVGTRLVCTDGPYAGRVYPLGPGTITVGRDPSCAVALPSDTRLSPVQATLTPEPGGHILTGEPVTVNGKPVTAPVSLRLGDRIGLGETVLRYQ